MSIDILGMSLIFTIKLIIQHKFYINIPIEIAQKNINIFLGIDQIISAPSRCVVLQNKTVTVFSA